MDFKNLKTFYTVARTGSFIKAAGELNYAHSTVSDHIRSLEKELGFPLFDRINKSIYITAYGRELLPMAEESVRLAEKIRLLGVNPGELNGDLRIGAIESFLQHFLPTAITEYRQTFPKVNVFAFSGYSSLFLEQLRNDQLDLAIVIGDYSLYPDLNSCCRKKAQLVFLTTPNNPLSGRAIISLKELSSEHLAFTVLCNNRFQDIAREQNLTFEHYILINNTTALKKYLQANHAISLLPRYCAAEELASGDLVILPVDIPDHVFHIEMLSKQGRIITPPMKEMIRLFEQSAL